MTTLLLWHRAVQTATYPRAGGISLVGSSDQTAPAPRPAAGAEREAEPQRGSSGHEGGLLTGAAGSALSPLPLSWGTNKPGSPMLQLPPQSPAAARCHPHGALGFGRARQSHQEGCGPRGSHAGGLRALKPRWLPGSAIAVTASCSLRRKPAVCARERCVPCPALGSSHHGSSASYTRLLRTSPCSLLSRFDLWSNRDPQAQQACLRQGEVMAQHRNACTDHVHLYRTDKDFSSKGCPCPALGQQTEPPARPRLGFVGTSIPSFPTSPVG